MWPGGALMWWSELWRSTQKNKKTRSLVECCRVSSCEQCVTHACESKLKRALWPPACREFCNKYLWLCIVVSSFQWVSGVALWPLSGLSSWSHIEIGYSSMFSWLVDRPSFTKSHSTIGRDVCASAILSHCPTIILSHRHTVILSYCHSVLLSYCPTVTLSYCHTVILSYCHTVILSYFTLSYCHTVVLSYCHTVLLSYCYSVLLLLCPTVLLSYCHTVILSYCHTVILSHCHTVILSYCHTVLLSYCHTVILSYCHTVILSCRLDVRETFLADLVIFGHSLIPWSVITSMLDLLWSWL